MIEYIVPNNPDDRVLIRAIRFMEDGGLVALPIDTNWIVATSCESKKGFENLCKIKGISDKEARDKHFALLCTSISQAQKYAVITNDAFKLIRKMIPAPYIFVFTPSVHLPRAIREYKKDGQIGIRFSASPLANALIERAPFPIMATRIHSEMLGCEKGAEVYGVLIEEEMSSQLSMIIDSYDYELVGPATVVDLREMPPKILREGVGDLSPFSRG